MDNKKQYRLLKDLPNVKAGTLFEWNSTETWSNGPYKGGRYLPKYGMEGDKSCTIIFTPDDVENNPEWFEAVSEPVKERIDLYFSKHSDEKFYRLYAEGKGFDMIKATKILESALNNDTVVEDSVYYGRYVSGIDEIKKQMTKFYENQIDAIRKETWEACRWFKRHAYFHHDNFQYPTLEDYLNSLPKEQGIFDGKNKDRYLADEIGKCESVKKPPLGVIPQFIHKEQRLDDIRQAINRFNKFYENKKLCPQEWLDEKHELENWLQKFNTKEQSDNSTGKELVCAVDLDWEIRGHSNDVSKVIKASECRFIGTPYECHKFITDHKPPTPSNDIQHKNAMRERGNDIQEPKEDTKVLFTTEDGVGLTKNNLKDEVWGIKKGQYKLMEQYYGKSLGTWLNGWYNTRWLANPKENDERTIPLIKEHYLVFSTKEAAEQYILNNKPFLNLRDIQELWHKHYFGNKLLAEFEEHLQELAKQKLNQQTN